MDFLTFKSFISIKALIIFYYIGALILPVGLWIFINWLIRKYDFFDVVYEKGKEAIWKSLNKKQQVKLFMFFVFFGTDQKGSFVFTLYSINSVSETGIDFLETP